MNVKLTQLKWKSNQPPLLFSRFRQIENKWKTIPSKSEVLCEQFLLALNQKIPNLLIKHKDHWSSISNDGLTMIWITENRIWGSIKIWFVGDSQKATRFAASTIKLKSTPVSSVWGDCRGNFRISEEAQIAQAVELLYAVSYPALIEFRKLSTIVASAKDEPDYVPSPNIVKTYEQIKSVVSK